MLQDEGMDEGRISYQGDARIRRDRTLPLRGPFRPCNDEGSDKMKKEDVYKKLTDAVVSGDEKLSTATAHDAISMELDAYECIQQGLNKGMQIVSDLYEQRKVFVPQILRSARAMNMAVEILKPHLEVDSKSSGTVVLGVVEGDIHDIGKNLVKLLCEAAGYTVVDLGKSVTKDAFVASVKDSSPQVVGMSSLMTTSMVGMPDVIAAVREVDGNIKIIIGGGAVSQSYADTIGADGYADDAAKAVKLIGKLVGA
ncbi:cobalamin-binding protein [archaeon]|nr:MAG: cobalamin-binding protein [archaeon]